MRLFEDRREADVPSTGPFRPVRLGGLLHEAKVLDLNQKDRPDDPLRCRVGLPLKGTDQPISIFSELVRQWAHDRIRIGWGDTLGRHQIQLCRPSA